MAAICHDYPSPTIPYICGRGLVDFAEPQVDPKTGTFSVRATMPNPERAVLPGQFTKVKILPRRSGGRRSGSCKVAYRRAWRKLRICDATFGKVEKRFAEIGPEVDNRVVIERGLVSGEMVVVEGQHKLSPGNGSHAYKTEEGE